LNVLDQRELEGAPRRDVLDDDHRLAKLRLLARAPATLPRDDLELVHPRSGTAHDDRLEQPVLADRLGELIERLRVEVLSRLPLLRRDLLERAEKDALVSV